MSQKTRTSDLMTASTTSDRVTKRRMASRGYERLPLPSHESMETSSAEEVDSSSDNEVPSVDRVSWELSLASDPSSSIRGSI